MPNCSPSYDTIDIPVNPASCGPDCEGVSVTVKEMKVSTSGGKATFEWTVVRERVAADGSKTSTTFADDATIGCPGVKEVIFYCDAAKNCPIMKLILKCTKGGND